SEGQAQRIAIARALLREKSVILMDEPTAALDVATEALLLERLAQYAPHRTMIIVTHHPSAAELCDAVVRVE
ncbi:MAG: ATP-binding cassette domain-containing protein, partial [Alistipes sp.]|nr:ATP-binding cassette domain-containing protein [Alistipes sp.]